VTEPKDVIKQLTSSDADAQCRAVRCLKNEIIGNPNRKQCFVQLGAVPRIVRILAHPQEQRLAIQAAAALGSFAYQNTDGVAAIVESGGVAHLMKALTNADMKLVEAGVRALKMIFQSPISPRDVIFVHPSFDRLVAFLDCKEKSFAEDVLIIFAKCCQTRQHQELLLKSDALPKMIKLLLSPVTSIQFAAMEALEKLSSRHSEVCEALLKRDDVMKTLMRFVRGRNVRVQFAACCLLSNLSVSLATGDSSNGWFSSEVTEVLVNLLDEPSVYEGVPRTLADIAHDRRDLQTLIFNANGFRKLWKFLTIDSMEDNTSQQIGIVRALGVMCQYLTTCRKEIVTSRTIWRVLAFVRSESALLRLAACFCFENIAAQSEKAGGSFPVTLFSTESDIRLMEYACTALAVLMSEQQDMDTHYEEMVEFLLPCATSLEHSIRTKAVWALGNVIRSRSKLKCKKWLEFLNDSLWNVVRGMVQDSEDEVQEEGLRFLQAMVGCDVGMQAAVDWSNGELLPLIAQKLDTPKLSNEKVTTLALDIAALAANAEVEYQTALMGSGLPPRLLGCLEESCSEQIKLAAITCVINLTYRDVLPWGGEDYRSAESRAIALLELGIDSSLGKLAKADGSASLKKRIKEAVSFLVGSAWHRGDVETQSQR